MSGSTTLVVKAVLPIYVLTRFIAFADRHRVQHVFSQYLGKLAGRRPPYGAMGKTLPGLYPGRFMLLWEAISWVRAGHSPK